MHEKNHRIQKRLERINRLVDQSIAELRGIKVKARRVGAVCQTPHRRRSRATSKAPGGSAEPSGPPASSRGQSRPVRRSHRQRAGAREEHSEPPQQRRGEGGTVDA